jgi:hypothetical protein
MAQRDPAKTAVNRQIAAMTASLKAQQAHVMAVLQEPTVLALHGRIGGKNAEFIDVKNEVILSPEAYVATWIEGFLRALASRRPLRRGDSYFEILLAIQTDGVVEDYVVTFLKRTYLRNRDALSRVRPRVGDAEIWIGQQRASYGILVTPRFVNGRWENDKSEIRHFPEEYWTIGHVLETGLVVPNDQDKIVFQDPLAYLAFFKNTLVRLSGSKHEAAIAERYVQYVKSQAEPRNVPLLIPEFRYGGVSAAHQYRLDFTIIDPYSMDKVGFELSPWSTHGLLTGTGQKTQQQINDEAKGNFEREMKKHKDYFRQHGVYALIYTDSDLADPDQLFDGIRPYLAPQRVAAQLQIQAMDALHRFKA